MITTTQPAPAATGTCIECGRKLRSAKSIAAGRGPTCAKKVAAAAKTADLSAWKPAQVESAWELIADAAIVHVKKGIFRSVSTDGKSQYITTAKGCNCPAGLKTKFTNCYHRAAVAILTHA